MRLILAKGTSPWATILRTEHGEPAYKTEVTDSSGSGGDTTTVYKIPLGQGVRVEPDQASITGVSNLTIFELATVKMRLLHSDEYTINGRSIKVDTFYKKEGLEGWFGYGRDRVWTGPDGVRYRWKTKDTKPELYLNDGDKRLVTKFHREHSGFFSEACPASLEFFGQLTQELVDMIVLTFVHLEKKRAEYEKAGTEAAAESLGSLA